MAQVYAPPKEAGHPPSYDIKLPNEENERKESAWIQQLADLAKKSHAGDPDLIGEVIRFPCADGLAFYMVWRTTPLVLVHLPQRYRLPAAHERGLELEDVRFEVNRNRNLVQLFVEQAERQSREMAAFFGQSPP